jgi:hypothetical protein
METELKTETILPNLDDLFRALGECDYLFTKTTAYIESLKEERELIIKLIEEIQNGKQDDIKNLGNEE